MNPTQVQRWRFRREAYRPAGEPIRTADYDVAELPGKDARAIAFVEEHHYSASYPAGRFAFGLYRASTLSGIAVFSVPPNDACLTKVFGCGPLDATELGRFVLLDDVAANGETWFLARAFELLRKHELAGVVSFSDPVPRTTVDGRLVTPGHVGTIYQAFNGRMIGRSRAQILRLLPDGTVFSRRTEQKVVHAEKGWRGAVAKLMGHGAPAPEAGEPPALWLARILPSVTRPLRHPGNYKYAWPLRRSVRRALPCGLPYPKKRCL